MMFMQPDRNTTEVAPVAGSRWILYFRSYLHTASFSLFGSECPPVKSKTQKQLRLKEKIGPPFIRKMRLLRTRLAVLLLNSGLGSLLVYILTFAHSELSSVDLTGKACKRNTPKMPLLFKRTLAHRL